MNVSFVPRCIGMRCWIHRILNDTDQDVVFERKVTPGHKGV